MTNAIEFVHKTMRNNKVLRRHSNQSAKARRHRYERRKIRTAIRLGDWNEDDLT